MTAEEYNAAKDLKSGMCLCADCGRPCQMDAAACVGFGLYECAHCRASVVPPLESELARLVELLR